MTPVCLPGTDSRLVEDAGRTYRVFIAAPTGPAPPEGFPVLFMLDASVFFGTVVETVRLRARRPDATGVGAALIVGVDCGIAGREERDREYSWPGNAPTLLQFMTGRLRELLAADYSVNWNRQILLGHSLGGFFVLYTLVTKPAAFNAYVALSPSIWTNRAFLFDGAQALSLKPADEARVFISIGEYEQKLAPWQSATVDATQEVARRRAARAMVDNAREFAGLLTKQPGMKVVFHDFPAEDHASAALIGIHHCLRFVLAPAPASAVI